MSDPGTSTTALSREDREELTALCHSYASCVDTRDFEAVGPLFTADAVLSMPNGRREGRDAIVAAMHGLERYDRTFHLVGQIRQWVEDGVVRGETYCVAHHFTEGGAGGTEDRVMYIRYQDEFERDDVWRFARRKLDVVWAGQEDKPSGTS